MTDMQADEAPGIERTVIDGVPVLWTPIDGPRVASLVFRVGRADEPTHQGGITHLVEHLALAPLTQQDYGHNGFVAAIRTVFHASGSDAQLVAFFASVTSSLHALPVDRIGLERRILTQESASRGNGASATIRWFRYGDVGHGLVGAPELGLAWLGPEPVQAWARERFTRDNAVLWISGPPPDGLRLALPDGQRSPAPSAPAIPGLSFPCRTDLGGTGASVSFVAPRSAATRMMIDILLRRIRQDLRFERGLVYDVTSDYDPLDANDAHVAVGADCRREDAPAVIQTIIDTLDSLRGGGATLVELAREATSFAEGSAHTNARFGFLDGAAFDALLGRPEEPAAAIIAEYLAVSQKDIAVAASTALGSLLVLAPPGPYDTSRLLVYPRWSSARVAGTTYRRKGMPIGPKAKKDRLTVAEDGVSWTDPEGRSVTVRYADCVAARHWDGSVRELWGADGFRVFIRAKDWWGGDEAVRRIDAAVPAAVVACDEHGIGALAVEEAQDPAGGTPAGGAPTTPATPTTPA